MKLSLFNPIVATSLLIVTLLLGCGTENKPTFKLAVSASSTEGGSVSPSNGVFDKNEDVILAASPSNGWKFVRWEGDFGGVINPVTLRMTRDYTIIAVFEKRDYPLIITIEGEGTVAERVVTAKTTEHPFQTVVELTPTPSEGWTFKEWGGDLSGNEPSVQITIVDEMNVTAKFVQKSYSLTTSAIGRGYVEFTPVLNSYVHGTVVSFTPVSDDDWTFNEWAGDISGNSKVMQVTMLKDMNVVAEFNREQSADPFLSVNVNWADLDAFHRTADQNQSRKGRTNASFMDSPQLDDEITHFGIRLVYPTANAVFIQSVAKIDVENQALITLEVPPAENIFMFAVAVSSNQAILFGTMDSINVVKGQEYNWKVEDFTWTQTDWMVVDSLKSVYETGTITASRNSLKFDLPIWVKNPFYDFLARTSTGAGYLSSPIKINGSGGGGFDQKSNQYTDIIFTFGNPSPGTAGTTIISDTYPRLDASMFNLPGKYYVIKDYLRGSINWE